MGSASRLIRQARQATGLTQASLAARIGQPQSVISDWERGRRDPTTGSLEKVLAATGRRLTTVTEPDAERSGRLLLDVLELADQLPHTRRRPDRLGPSPFLSVDRLGTPPSLGVDRLGTPPSLGAVR